MPHNPIEPPPFRTVLKPPTPNRFADVRGGASGGRGGMQGTTGFPPPAPESYLRYDTGDGQGMREWLPSQEPSRGTVSMMTAPENVDRVTYGSQMQDLDIAGALAQRRQALAMMQPYEPGMGVPGMTVGEARQRMLAQENAQQTLARLERQFGNIESQRTARMNELLGSGQAPDQAKLDADDYAMRLERRALMAEQLAQGRALPSGAFDNRY